MRINEMVRMAYGNAVDKGFYEDVEVLSVLTEGVVEHEWEVLDKATVATRLMLIVSEVGEAVEALRHNDTAAFHEELADIAIRLGDLCGHLEVDLEEEIRKKMERNKRRDYKHGKEF